jgi:hypothetical protein
MGWERDGADMGALVMDAFCARMATEKDSSSANINSKPAAGTLRMSRVITITISFFV